MVVSLLLFSLMLSFAFTLQERSNETLDPERTLFLCRNDSLLRPLNLLNDSMLKAALEDDNIDRLTLHFCTENYLMNSVLEFRNKKSVNLIGNVGTLFICNSDQGETGIKYENVYSVTMQTITLEKCGAVYVKNEIGFNTGISITSSHFILVENVVMNHTNGTGISIVNSKGNVTVNNSIFEGGCVFDSSGGGGLYIDISNEVTHFPEESMYAESSFHLIISSSTFRENHAHNAHYISNKIVGTGNGGGLNIELSKARNNTINITDCTFERNIARYWGGGLNIVLRNNSENNVFSVDHCHFMDNWALKGGGGADIGYLFSKGLPKNNSISFTNSVFCANSANAGGGMYVYSTLAETSENAIRTNKILFRNCSWRDNQAKYAAAVYLVPQIITTFNRNGNLPVPTFENCRFHKNRVCDHNCILPFRMGSSYSRRNYEIVHRGKASFFSIGYNIIFMGEIDFVKNSWTALYLVSSIVTVKSETNVMFDENTGRYGGAVSLYGSSTLHLCNNVHFTFTNNVALVQGGALYQKISTNLEYIAKTNCFIHYIGSDREGDKNISFSFANNTILGSDQETINCLNCGKSLLISSKESCNRITDFTQNSTIAKFFFENSTQYEISTEGTLNVVNKPPILELIPGKKTNLPIKVTNDFGFEIYSLIQTIILNSSVIRLDSSSTYIYMFYHKDITLLGAPGARGVISLSLTSTKDTEVHFKTILLECPPGYVHNPTTGSCECSADTAGSAYIGISKCNSETIQAALKRAYWIGYREENDSVNLGHEQNLYSSLCPRRFCTRIIDSDVVLLPNTSDVEELDKLVCGTFRTGILCAECRENHSAFYHSENFDCTPDKHCNWGWLFFLISELLPATLLFIVITLLNIQITSGSIQGFILYVQMFDTLLITANGQIVLKRNTYYALLYLRFIYRMFNLEFFTNSKLSFCLWKNASSLDILTMKYITIAYSLLLVLAVVLILRRSISAERLVRKIFKQKVNHSIIHGLSGFLIMCYSQCTKVSILILTPIVVYAKGPIPYKTVALYDGRLTFMNGAHLLYAIPALLFTVTLVVLPPLLFITYPLCYRVFSLLHIQESTFSRMACKVIPLERFRPFFDSFQSSFKDEYRYFSGLYFLYRLTALLSFALFHNLSEFYTVVLIQFVLILIVHAWIQPYKKQWHNRLDAYIFATLALIIGMTLYRYTTLQHHNRKEKFMMDMSIFDGIHVAVAYLPFIYVLGYSTWNIFLKLRKYWKSMSGNVHVQREDNELEVSLPMIREESMELTSSYNREETHT